MPCLMVRKHVEEEIDADNKVRLGQERLQVPGGGRLAHARRSDECDQLTCHQHSLAQGQTAFACARPERPGGQSSGRAGAAAVQTWWAQWRSPSRRVPWLVVIATSPSGDRHR